MLVKDNFVQNHSNMEIIGSSQSVDIAALNDRTVSYTHLDVYKRQTYENIATPKAHKINTGKK